MRSFLRYFLTLSLGLFFVASYQNCGNVSVGPKSSSAVFQSMTSTDLGKVCSPESISVVIPQKVLMVLDMSASNTSFAQENIPESDPGNPSYFYYLGQEAYDFCMADEANRGPCRRPTDLAGARFTALESYLNNCPQNLSPQNSYGVVGFSSFPLAPRNSVSRSCEDPLFPKNIALSDIDGFRKLQEHDLSLSVASSTAYPFKMHQTSYMNAFQCTERRIRNDVGATSLQKDYKILFVTDGKPSDKDNSNRFLPNSAYVNTLKSLQTFLQGQGYRLLFQPIFYGDSSDVSERTDALDKLDAMADAIKTGTKTIVLDSLTNDFTNQLSDSLCKSPVETLTSPYTIVGSPVFFPITSQQKGDQIYADQDVDGIPDDIESSLGFDKSKSRSNKILDSLCSLQKSDCLAFTMSCDPNLKIGYGFTDCDKKFIDDKILKVATTRAPAFQGLDYDGDGMLDFFELMKGTNPFVKDMNLDDDGDNVSNQDEIVLGTDPKSYTDQSLRLQFQSQINSTPDSSCKTGRGFSVSTTHLPFVTVSGNLETHLSPHDENQNVFAMVYFAKPLAIDSHQVSVFVGYVKIDKNRVVITEAATKVGTMEVP